MPTDDCGRARNLWHELTERPVSAMAQRWLQAHLTRCLDCQRWERDYSDFVRSGRQDPEPLRTHRRYQLLAQIHTAISDARPAGDPSRRRAASLFGPVAWRWPHSGRVGLPWGVAVAGLVTALAGWMLLDRVPPVGRPDHPTVVSAATTAGNHGQGPAETLTTSLAGVRAAASPGALAWSHPRGYGLWSGSLMVMKDPEAAGEVIVETPHGIVSVYGTALAILVDDERTDVWVTHGLVTVDPRELSTSEARLWLSGAEGATVSDETSRTWHERPSADLAPLVDALIRWEQSHRAPSETAANGNDDEASAMMTPKRRLRIVTDGDPQVARLSGARAATRPTPRSTGYDVAFLQSVREQIEEAGPDAGLRTLRNVEGEWVNDATQWEAYALEVTLLRRLNRLDEAATLLERIGPGSPTALQRAAAALELGRLRRALGSDADQIVAAFRSAQLADPEGPLADSSAFEECHVERRRRSWPRAAQCFERFLNDYPESMFAPMIRQWRTELPATLVTGTPP